MECPCFTGTTPTPGCGVSGTLTAAQNTTVTVPTGCTVNFKGGAVVVVVALVMAR